MPNVQGVQRIRSLSHQWLRTMLVVLQVRAIIGQLGRFESRVSSTTRKHHVHGFPDETLGSQVPRVPVARPFPLLAVRALWTMPSMASSQLLSERL